MKKEMTLEEAISRGYNSRKIEQLAKSEIGEHATRREMLSRITQAERKVKN